MECLASLFVGKRSIRNNFALLLWKHRLKKPTSQKLLKIEKWKHDTIYQSLSSRERDTISQKALVSLKHIGYNSKLETYNSFKRIECFF